MKTKLQHAITPLLVLAFSLSAFAQTAPAAGRASASDAWLQPLLAKPGIDVVLVVGNLEQSTKFYAEGIGMKPLGEPRKLNDGARVQELQFGTTVFRLRQPATPPKDGPTVKGAELKEQIVAAKGFRLMFLLVKDSAPIGERLQKLGFPAPVSSTTSGVGGYKLVADPDGNIVGLQMPRGRGAVPSLQLALTVSDETQWREFVGGKLGLPYVGNIPMRSQQMTEFRYMAGESAVKFWGPPGDKPAMGGPLDARRGVRACVIPVTDLARVEKELATRGLQPLNEPASTSDKTLTIADADGNLFQFIERPSSGQKVAVPAAPAPGESRTANATFDRFDRNKDGTITNDELRNAQIFERLDRNNDGKITREEAARLLGRRGSGEGEPPPPSDAKPRQPTKGGPLLFDGTPGPATDAAAGETQLFEQVFIKGITDVAVPAQGMAWVDLNGDRRLDVFVMQREPKMFLNQGNFEFKEQPLHFDGEVTGSQAPTFADFNGDGWLDFYLSTVGGRNRANLFIAQGAWDHFKDFAVPMGLDNAGAYARGQISVGDVNRDGWLDMAIAANAIGSGGPISGRPLSRLYVYRPAKDGVFEHGKFEDVGGTEAIRRFGGVNREKPNRDLDINGMCAVLRDLDGDGDLDLLRAAHNDMLRGDPLNPFATGDRPYGMFAWRNEFKESGKLKFTELMPGPGSLTEHGRSHWDANAGHYVTAQPAIAAETILPADIDNDGDLDVLVTGITGPSVIVHSLWTAARVWRNDGNLKFTDLTESSGLGALNWFAEQWGMHWGTPIVEDNNRANAKRGEPPFPRGDQKFALKDHQLYFGNSVWGDFNNDGWVDLFQVTRFNGRNIRGSWRSNLFLNRGDGSFEVVKTELSGVNEMGLAAQAVDVDGDGRLDIVLMRREEKSPEAPLMVFWNTGRQFGAADNHWLQVKLTGLPQRQLIGAKLFAEDESGNLLGRRDYFVDAMRGSHEAAAHFGLGKHTRATLRVELPDGTTRRFHNLAAGRAHSLDVASQRTTP